MVDVMVWASENDHACELISKARELASGGKVIALALGDRADAKMLASKGADVVLTNNDGALKGLQVEPYADALHQAIQARKPGIVLVGSGIRSKDVAGRVATRLEVGCASEAINLRLDGGRLVSERAYYSGNSFLTEKLPKDPQIAVVPARAYEANATGQGTVEALALQFKPAKARLVESVAKPSGGVHLEEADIVVSVGRGVKKKEDLALAQQLCQATGGSLGCTRPIAADLKWLGDENWIGLSGHEIKPKAYIGLGVSGQIQHVAGMRGSKLIIAINKDEEAPLVKISDYAIVDDLYKVVPALVKEVQKIRGG